MKSHKDLDVYKMSINFVKTIYKTTSQFPDYELFGITSQIRKASVSIPCNIAEGSARKHSKEFQQFLYIALSSASETDTLLTIAFELNFISQADYQILSDVLNSISKMLQGLIRSIQK